MHDLCDGLVLAGRIDWRLSTAKELTLLTVYFCKQIENQRAGIFSYPRSFRIDRSQILAQRGHVTTICGIRYLRWVLPARYLDVGISTFLLVKGAIGALKASAVKSTAAGAAKLVVTNPTASSTLLVSIKSTLVGAGKYAAAKVTAGATAAAASGAVGGTAALLAVGASYGGIRLTKSIVNNSKRFVKALSKGDYESAIIHVFEVLKEGGSACDVS